MPCFGKSLSSEFGIHLMNNRNKANRAMMKSRRGWEKKSTRRCGLCPVRRIRAKMKSQRGMSGSGGVRFGTNHIEVVLDPKTIIYSISLALLRLILLRRRTIIPFVNTLSSECSNRLKKIGRTSDFQSPFLRRCVEWENRKGSTRHSFLRKPVYLHAELITSFHPLEPSRAHPSSLLTV